MDKKNKLLGKIFGKLTCIENLGRKGHNYLIKCSCQCGNSTNVLDCNLKSGRTKSCGCWNMPGNQNINWKGYGEISSTYFNQIKLGAKDRKIEFNVTIEHIWELFLRQSSKCALSGVELTFMNNFKDRYNQTASLDRIDSSKGYIKGNVQWVHKDLNFMKQDFQEEYFIRMCRLVAKKCHKYINKNDTNLDINMLRGKFLNLNDFYED